MRKDKNNINDPSYRIAYMALAKEIVRNYKEFMKKHPEIGKDVENFNYLLPNAPIYNVFGIYRKYKKKGRFRDIIVPNEEFKHLMKRFATFMKMSVYYIDINPIEEDKRGKRNNSYIIGLNADTSIGNMANFLLKDINPHKTSVIKYDIKNYFNSISYIMFISVLDDIEQRIAKTISDIYGANITSAIVPGISGYRKVLSFESDNQETDLLNLELKQLLYYLQRYTVLAFYRGILQLGFPTSPLFAYYYSSINKIHRPRIDRNRYETDLQILRFITYYIDLTKKTQAFNIVKSINGIKSALYETVINYYRLERSITINAKEIEKISNYVKEDIDILTTEIANFANGKFEINSLMFTLFTYIKQILSKSYMTIGYVDDLISIYKGNSAISKKRFVLDFLYIYKNSLKSHKSKNVVRGNEFRKSFAEASLFAKEHTDELKRLFEVTATFLLNVLIKIDGCYYYGSENSALRREIEILSNDRGSSFNMFMRKLSELANEDIYSTTFNIDKYKIIRYELRKAKRRPRSGSAKCVYVNLSDILYKNRKIIPALVKEFINKRNPFLTFSYDKTKIMFKETLKHFLGIYWLDKNVFSVTNYKKYRNEIFEYYKKIKDGIITDRDVNKIQSNIKRFDGFVSFATSVIDAKKRASLQETLDMYRVVKDYAIQMSKQGGAK